MPAGKAIKTYPLLAPLAWLYGGAVRLRNRLFNRGVLPAERYPVPVICIGNVTVGGTGKTPHTEYLIRFLSQHYRVAVISRGYKRKTSGFILAGEQSDSREIGDEPFQMKRKFPGILLAVDSDRRRAIRTLLQLPEPERPEVVLLDDAFQHRYVTPSLSVLLTDYNRPYYRDRLLPAGRLREPARAARRAGILVVTKCKSSLPESEYRAITSELNVQPGQHLFFTGIEYGELQPVFPSAGGSRSLRDTRPGDEILAVSGIASPEPLINELRRYTSQVTAMNFPDHHVFNSKDIERIRNEFGKLSRPDKFIVVTEKDAVRLIYNQDIEEEWKARFFYLPITVVFHRNREKAFRELILDHIRTFRQNSLYAK